jgi:ribosomal protein S18 acetylase RimI-like enzyme
MPLDTGAGRATRRSWRTKEGASWGPIFVRANRGGGGAHVANCGYITAPAAQGRGVVSAMLSHSLARARERGFRGMKFNCVISTNTRALQTWQGNGFAIVRRLPEGFHHPKLGYVCACDVP